ncbi:hypothetical protein [Peribacillus simplex]|uniref:hypothetical protein n=1 Tax=Peribacillus simplex TaxID=1478 RepID=UPI003D29F660
MEMVGREFKVTYIIEETHQKKAFAQLEQRPFMNRGNTLSVFPVIQIYILLVSNNNSVDFTMNN